MGCLVEEPAYPRLHGLLDEDEDCEVFEEVEAVFLRFEIGVDGVEAVELEELDEAGIEIVLLFEDKEPNCCVCCLIFGDDNGETNE